MNRALSDHEEAVLRFLLGDGRPGADRVLESLPHLRVIGRCGCGCGTVDFQDRRKHVPWERQELFAEAVSVRTGVVVHVLVDVDRLVPTTLEVYSTSDDVCPLPEVASLTLVPAQPD